MAGRIRRGAMWVGGVTLVLVLAGVFYQMSRTEWDKRNVPVTGRMVSVEGRSMHLQCSGSGSPIVVLEAGAIGFADTFARLQPELAKVTRVCSYDRAGLGWSDPSPLPRSGKVIATELRQLLTAAGERPPYVLAGHSLGGLLIRAYAEQYPDEVVALGFIDSSHPDQLERFPPEFRETFQRFVSMFDIAPVLAHLGVLRVVNPITSMAAGLPEAARRTAAVFASSPKHLRTTREEFAAWDAITADAASNETLGDKPVVVLSASVMNGVPPELLPINHQMHREIAALSSRSRHRVIEGSDHYSIIMDPAHARRTASELRWLIHQVRQ